MAVCCSAQRRDIVLADLVPDFLKQLLDLGALVRELIDRRVEFEHLLHALPFPHRVISEVILIRLWLFVSFGQSRTLPVQLGANLWRHADSHFIKLILECR